MTTIHGDFPGGSIGNLPAIRCAYNAYTERGLSNLQEGKINLLNFNWGEPYKGNIDKTLLCTDRRKFQAVLEPICQYIVGMKLRVIMVSENEPMNAVKIPNTSLATYCNVLLWTKEVCAKYGIPVMQGHLMQPETIKIHMQTLPSKKLRDDMSRHFKSQGFFIGTKAQADQAVKLLQFCKANDIGNGFHWQQEYQVLPDVITTLRQYDDKISNNELAARKQDTAAVRGLFEAVNGTLEYVVWYNRDMGRDAIEWNAEMKSELLSLV